MSKNNYTRDIMERADIYHIAEYILFGAGPNKRYIDELKKLDTVDERANREYDEFLTLLEQANFAPVMREKIVNRVDNLIGEYQTLNFRLGLIAGIQFISFDNKKGYEEDK